MKLEKDDRIISNADYEKLVALAELHERAINEVVNEKVTEVITEELVPIHKYIKTAQNCLLYWAEQEIALRQEIYKKRSLLELKNEIIKEKNAEIARLQKKYWWKLI